MGSGHLPAAGSAPNHVGHLSVQLLPPTFRAYPDPLSHLCRHATSACRGSENHVNAGGRCGWDFLFPKTMKNQIITLLPRRLLALAALLGATVLAHAHSVWIEDNAEKQLIVRFGEFGEEYEKSPGHLDSLSLPVAWTAGKEDKPATFFVEKKADHFLFVGANPAANALGETVFPVMKRGKRPASWPQFYVRWQAAGVAAPAAPELTLDILPTATAGQFRIYLRGQPLADATVQVHGQAKAVDLKTDADGRFTYAASPGLVLLTCNHKEELKGFAGGVAYEVTSHNTALTWRQP